MNRLVLFFALAATSLTLTLGLPNVAFAQASACPPPPPPPPAQGQPANLAQALNPDCNVTWARWVLTIWRLTMSFVNVAVVLLIIVIALATILHWNIDTYGFKKALPAVVIAVVLANFSMVIVRALVDVASILTATFAGNTQVLARGIVGAILGMFIAPASGIVGYPIVFFLFGGVSILLSLLGAILAVLIPAIGIFILWFLLFIRVSVILVFTAVAPLAFMAMALPATQPYFQRWWGTMLNWIFMAPVVFLLLRIGAAVGELSVGNLSNAQGAGFLNVIIPFIIALGALYMAIMTPFKMGGAITAAWAGLGKAAAGLGWKGYGSLGVAAEDWKKEENKGKARYQIGQFLNRYNLYGTKKAFQERLERSEAYRESAFKDSPAYRRLAGYDVAYRHHLQDKREAVNAIEDPEVLQKRMKDYIDKNPQLRTLSTDELRDLIYSGPKTQQRLFQKYQVTDPEQAAWFALLMRRAQILARRVRQPADLGRVLDDAYDGNFAKSVREGDYKTDKEHPEGAKRQKDVPGWGKQPPPPGTPPTPPPGPGPAPGTPRPGVSGGSPEASFRNVGLNDAQIRSVMDRLQEGHSAIDIAQELGIGAQITPSGAVRIYNPDQYRTFQKTIEDVIKTDPDLAELHNAQYPTSLWVKTLQSQRKESAHTQLETSYREVDAAIRRQSKDPNFSISPVLAQHAKVLVDLNPQINPTYLAELTQDPNRLLGEIGHAMRAASVLRDNIDLPEQQVTARVRQAVNLERDIRMLRGHMQSAVATAPGYEQAVGTLTQDANLRKTVDEQVKKISQRTGRPIDPTRFMQNVQQSAQQSKDVDDLLSFSAIRDSLRAST